MWTTGHAKRPRSQPFGANEAVSQSHENKFGKAQTMSGHAGKYTPSESVPNLAHRYATMNFTIWYETHLAPIWITFKHLILGLLVCQPAIQQVHQTATTLNIS